MRFWWNIVGVVIIDRFQVQRADHVNAATQVDAEFRRPAGGNHKCGNQQRRQHPSETRAVVVDVQAIGNNVRKGEAQCDSDDQQNRNNVS